MTEKDRVRVYLVGVASRENISKKFDVPYCLESFYNWKGKAKSLRNWCDRQNKKEE
jgi:hypothetical protein